MRDNVVTAVYNGTGRCKTASLYQWDYGQRLQIKNVDLPSAYEVQFSDSFHGNAITQIGNADGVSIPDILLVTGKTIYAWLYIHDSESDGSTELMIVMPVIARAKPHNAEPTPVQQDAITEAIAALNQAVEDAETAVSHYPIIFQGVWCTWNADYNAYVTTGVQAQGATGAQGERGPKGDTGATGAKGDTGATGAQGPSGPAGPQGLRGEAGITYTPSVSENGVLSWTNNGGAVNPDPVSIKGDKGDTGNTGPAGADGSDGYSPTATVNKYGDTTVITITDKNGTTTESVTDGSDGEDGTDGTDGTTFTPSVASNGDLSWTNDGGKTNPATVNIKGPAGASGEMTEETVTGTTPSITGVNNHRYICGECSTLTVTLPESGCIDVTFESGSTATVLTVTPPTGYTKEWANGFDETSLDANTTYEINISMVGTKCLGVACSWT